ncbi:hypothetical protein C1646_376485 [Rhizophagus diaphanus]|nr:hypothetical protein C1646_376485 [Rhizophagus diaphanus] [Rhizophagus sp. MUCL 43196]
MNILFGVFLIFVTFVSSTPIRRQDALSGFKPCQGNFPNEITLFIFTPNPLVGGQEFTVRIAGKVTVTIESGALYKLTVNKQGIHETSFCKEFVIPSGFTCPVNDNFDFTAKPHTISKDTKVEYDIKIMITNPDGKDLSCIEGKVNISHP